jgi:hypothetical protein
MASGILFVCSILLFFKCMCFEGRLIPEAMTVVKYLVLSVQRHEIVIVSSLCGSQYFGFTDSDS